MLRNVVKVSSVGGYPAVRASSVRFRSTQVQPQPVATADGREPEWDSALPYSKVPGPSVLKMVKDFAPGGRYHNANIQKMHRLFREDYGDLVRMPGILGRRDVLLSFRPDDFEMLFRNEGQWPIRRGIDTFVYYRKHVRPDVFKGLGGLVTEQGESWQKFRTTVNPVMMQPKIIKLYVDKLDDVAREFMKIMVKIRDDQSELPADFSQWLNRWALETMGVLALDTRLGVLEDAQSVEAKLIVKKIRQFFELTYQLDVLPSVWKYYKTPTFKKLMNVLDDLTNIVMAKVDEAVVRLEKNPSADSDTQSVLEKLLKVNREVAIVMAFDMLLAGVDTTSSGTTGILYLLATNKDKQAKLREELRTILPKKDSPLTPENMRNLPYLRACIKEGLRLCPPTAGNVRAAGKDLVLQGYQIPKGTDVAMASMILMQENQFVDRAKEFLPERWLKEDGYPNAKDAHPFLYLPFGFGSRTCIGRRLAMLEMEMIVSRITRQFDYRWNYGELEIRATLINVPVNDLKFQMTEVED
ncbi:cytochrome P450 CYP12A2-like [Ochlerotatus camptorhynchus]|uniref:cytochrome P450 CYP12A2-like n=1 Tax=Ochlerotatus camptorhynchus TaxID=644619 RepID=UPI0031D94012